MTQSKAPIGVFDSGVGGLGVLDTLVAQLPGEDFVYFGDTLHMPYGRRSLEEVAGFATRIWDWLYATEQVKLLVIACNTASAVVLRGMTATPPVPFVDTIRPVCQWLAAETPYRRIGLMATPVTVRSGHYQHVLTTLDPDMTVNAVECDGLASLIEAGRLDDGETDGLIARFTQPLSEQEAVILGCTHYPHIQRQISKHLPDVPLLDPAETIARRVRQLLQDERLLHPQPHTGSVRYVVSGDTDAFYTAFQTLPLKHLPHSKPVNVPLFAEALP